METDATTHMPTQFYVFDKIRQTVVPVPGMFGRNQTDINGIAIDPSLSACHHHVSRQSGQDSFPGLSGTRGALYPGVGGFHYGNRG